MTQYEYIEVPMSMDKPLLDQLNAAGKQGWQFITQAQRYETDRDLSLQGNGQKKITITLIYKRAKEVEYIKELDHAKGN